ncbi:MAG TPA: ATP-binding protein [Gemmatimonadales bacterium]|nr:ATP-binding protein [Gemmatimonadales bacterium]
MRVRLVLLVLVAGVPGFVLARHAGPRDFALAAAVALLAAAAAWVLGDLLLTRRINALAEVARRLSFGDRAVRTGGGYAPDEIGRLERAFDVMAAALERHEQALRRSEEKYRALVENSPYGISRTTPDGRFIDANPALARILGYDSVDDLIELDVASGVYRDPAARAGVVERIAAAGGFLQQEIEVRRKDGSPVLVRATARLVRGDVAAPPYLETITEDVTERRALEEQLRQAQKMDAIGRLAGGVAHDFNNLLTAIIGYADLIEADLGAASPHTEDVREIRLAADRAAVLTRQLLAFSRQQVLAPRVMDLNETVSGMRNMLRRLIGEDIELIVQSTPELGHVRADPGQMEQVVLNLALNARDAMPRGGRLIIETANVELDEEYARGHLGGTAGPHVMLAVTDTGVGMDAVTRARIFEPFFTTKEKGKGTGLGLATVYGIVRQSGGSIWVYSEPGAGTIFKVYFPRSFDVATPAVGALQRAEADGTETVLVVEDDDAVRTLARRGLEGYGYRVIEARNPGEAVAVSERHVGSIHLLVTDVVMPGQYGPELAQALRRERPELRVLYMSGYTDNAIAHQGLLEAGSAFLEKPFTPGNLAAKVRATLDA